MQSRQHAKQSAWKQEMEAGTTSFQKIKVSRGCRLITFMLILSWLIIREALPRRAPRASKFEIFGKDTGPLIDSDLSFQNLQNFRE